MENWRRRIARARGWFDGYSGPLEERPGVPARVYTVMELSPALQEVLVQKLESAVKGPVNAEFKSDPSIIGGMVIQIGSKVIDMSVARDLRELGHRVQEVIGAHLAELARTWTPESDLALEPDHAYLSQLARAAEQRLNIQAVH